jgi:PKD repeat protein
MKKILLSIFAFGVTSLGHQLFSQVQTIQSTIATSTDDAEERGLNALSSSGLMDLTSTDLEFVRDGNDGDQFLGLRFSNLSIPKGSVITKAYIQLTVDEAGGTPGSVIFKVEDTDSSSTFTGSNYDISSRLTLADSVIWSSIPSWSSVGASGIDQQTADLSSLIQLIVNRSGWKQGNSINFIATGTGDRTAESYDGASSVSERPTLVIEFIQPVTQTFSILTSSDDAEEDITAGGMDLTSTDIELTADGSANQIIGLRYQNITIPSGATIQNAYLQFYVDEINTTDKVDLFITAEDVLNSPAITSTSYLSTKNYLSSGVIWDSIQPWSNLNDAGANQQSPDLSGLVQSIVNKTGWSSGNAMLFGLVDPHALSFPGYVVNNSKRVAQTFDKNPARATKLIVTYIPPTNYTNGTFPIAKNSSWKYNDSGVNLSGTNWTDITYPDNSWKFGNGLLGYGDSPATTVDFGGNTSNKHVTTYFRHTFNVTDSSLYDSLVFNTLRDDGVVVYVNGTEAFRMNMPAGPITSSTLALSAVGGADEGTYFETKTDNLLKNGLNVIAVEVHQNSVTSSDKSFDMEVGFKLFPLSPAQYPFAKKTAWHYLDNESNLDTVAWKDTNYNDDNWDQGKGPLGYGNNETTVISYGPNPADKYITTYFRRDILIDTNTLPDSVELGLLRDDGAIVYLNGVEVRRDNLDPGPITYKTDANTIVSGSAETVYHTSILKKSQFIHGRNQLAIEIHNRDSTSSDLGFDLYIDAAPVANSPALGCAGGSSHIACFTSIAPTAQTSNLLIPTSSHRFQVLMQQGDNYSIGSGSMPGNNDFTGYIGLNGSSKIGHLSINHENSPGGVSMLDISYNDSLKLWNVDSSQAVDFYNSDLVSTIRNCSGGITPWGTIITAEENTSSGDANSDGYQDIGWLVEIDPITAKVLEYGAGKQEKLWGCGRISHENALVLNDSVTLYTGEDGGSSAVFKFIANNKMDLSQGDLYCLKLDAPLVGNEPTVPTGKWLKVPNTTQADRNNTRSLAMALGATNFNGVEDIEVSPIDGKIYFAAKGKGRVYCFEDNDSVVSQFKTFVGGTSYVLNTESGVYTEPWGGGNDNLTFDDQGNLWVLQDGGNNYIWLVRPDHTQSIPKVELFASFPIGSEPTGLTFSPDFKFGFVSVQHPSGSNTSQLDASLNSVTMNRSTTLVFSKKEFLGAQAPIAGFKADTTVVIVGDKVVFSDTSLNYPTSRNWIFNGGVPAISTKRIDTVTYNGVGTYEVRLNVSNAVGADTAIVSNYIRVINPKPLSQFAANKVFVAVGDTVEFWDFSTNNPDSLRWNFVSGTPSTSNATVPKVIYSSPGNFTVSLTAYNEAGSGNTETKLNYIQVVSTVGLNEENSEVKLNVFPNPTTGLITISSRFLGGENLTIELFDLQGRKLKDLIHTQTTPGVKNFIFDLSNYVSQSQSVILISTIDGRKQVSRINIIK